MNTGKSWPLFFIRLSGFVLIMCAGTALLSVHLQSGIGFLPNKSGGALGQELGAFSLNTFNITGGTLILFTLFLLGVTLFTGLSWILLAEKLGAFVLDLIQNMPLKFATLRNKFTESKVHKAKIKVSKSKEKAKITYIQPSDDGGINTKI